MRARLIVISRIRCKDVTQVALAKDNDVVQAFWTEFTNQAFSYTILPG